MSVRKVLVGSVVAGLLAVAGLALAQAGGRAGRGGRAGGGGAGFDPAQMRQGMMDRVKETLQAKDAEWKVLEPRLERVMTLSREASGFGRMGMFGGRRRGGAGQPGAPGAVLPQSDVDRATEALQTTVDDPKTTPAQIKAKLTAFRAAREKSRQELAKARESARELVTQRQEAQLVLMGILE